MAAETGVSEELFSEDDDPASPEIPVQSQRKESCSLPLVPRRCLEEGLMKKRQITSNEYIVLWPELFTPTK